MVRVRAGERGEELTFRLLAGLLGPVQGVLTRRGQLHGVLAPVLGVRDDLSSGRWAERNRDLVALDAAGLGLRLLIA